MTTTFTMPKFGETMEEGTIVKWLRRVGDFVKEGDILVEVDTDKTTLEVESTLSGTLAEILINTGETVPVNTPIALIEQA